MQMTGQLEREGTLHVESCRPTCATAHGAEHSKKSALTLSLHLHACQAPDACNKTLIPTAGTTTPAVTAVLCDMLAANTTSV